MKTTQKILGMLAWIMLVIGAGVSTVSAAAIGDSFKIGEYSAGWIFIGIGIILGIAVVIPKLLAAEIKKKVAAITIALLVIGVVLVGVTYDPGVAEVTADEQCPTVEIAGWCVLSTEASAYNDDITYDNDTYEFVIPLTVLDSSDGQIEDTIVKINFSLDPTSSGGQSADILWPVYYKSNQYDMKYNGEKVFSESSGQYDVEWSDSSGSTRYEGQQDIRIDSDGEADLTYTFNNNTAGNWVTELSQIGDTLSWTIEFWNGCGWSQTVDVTAIVISYTE